MLVNALACTVVACLYAPPEYKTLITTICLVALVYSIMMHRRLTRLSSSFKKVVLENLEKRAPTKLREEE
ncbi:hypothetical protein [Pseudomonas fluorescens]|uniref:Uncharacterized protein n=1 Tax=Pseudomonas fluorescens TaxID=294 RepID=A0A5E7WLD2_PSEFL|nr:hypothetical protein [Pseudomonas fluorescens]VVN05172.1 hypothetical protein PS624_03536 [Pseudomonas fluorescens]VVQ35125.1 hypothetical protein PS947_04388 [Pseudomonas fluorescens]